MGRRDRGGGIGERDRGQLLVLVGSDFSRGGDRKSRPAGARGG